MLYYMAVTTFLVFLVPIIVITVLYVLMGITLYKASHRPLNNNDGEKHEHIVLHHRGQRQFWLRQNTASLIKSRPIRNSRRAVLKMLGKINKVFFFFFIFVVFSKWNIQLNLLVRLFSGGCNCIFYLLGTISHTTYNCICDTIIR